MAAVTRVSVARAVMMIPGLRRISGAEQPNPGRVSGWIVDVLPGPTTNTAALACSKRHRDDDHEHDEPDGRERERSQRHPPHARLRRAKGYSPELMSNTSAPSAGAR